jgi:hypothetical protein
MVLDDGTTIRPVDRYQGKDWQSPMRELGGRRGTEKQ